MFNITIMISILHFENFGFAFVNDFRLKQKIERSLKWA